MPADRSALLAEFGRRVRQQRTARGLSLEGLSERVGLHWTYIGSVERGKRNISLVNIVRLAAALDVDAGELVRGLVASTDVVCDRPADLRGVVM